MDNFSARLYFSSKPFDAECPRALLLLKLVACCVKYLQGPG